MLTTNRSYNEEYSDFKRIIDFLIANNNYINEFTSFSLPRFVDWKFGLYPPKTSITNFWSKNGHLWFDSLNNLVAFVISESNRGDLLIITALGFRFLYKEIMKWVITNWPKERYFIEVSQKQLLEIETLNNLDFTIDFTAYKRQFDLTKPLIQKYSLPEGFQLIDMENNPEYREQRILRSNAFDGNSNITEEEIQYQLAFYNNTHNAPFYHPYTNLCIKERGGIHVAGCEALLNPWNLEADVERVCTHSQYRRRGLGKFVLQECLNRLQKMGYKRAFITGFSEDAINLYGQLGADNELKIYIYTNKEVLNEKNN